MGCQAVLVQAVRAQDLSGWARISHPPLNPHTVLAVRCQPAVLGHCMGLPGGTMAPLLSFSEHPHACREPAGPPCGRRQDINAVSCSGAQPLKLLPLSAEVK